MLWDVDLFNQAGRRMSLAAFTEVRALFINASWRKGSQQTYFASDCLAHMGKLHTLSLRGAPSFKSIFP